MDKIILPQINITACHGVYDEEKLHPQPFCIAVELYTDISSAVQSDNVADTVDYSVLFKKIKTLEK